VLVPVCRRIAGAGRLRTSCKDQVHGVLAKLGVPVTCTDIFGLAGSARLDGLGLPQPYAGKVASLRHLTGELTGEITMLSEVIAGLLASDRGYQVIQQLPGIGPVLAAVIIAEIGDVTRFQNAPAHPGLLRHARRADPLPSRALPGPAGTAGMNSPSWPAPRTPKTPIDTTPLLQGSDSV
jgi:transposase